MARPRTSRHDLPERVYCRRGVYYFVQKDGKWIRLDSDYAKAMAMWAELIQLPTHVDSMNDLFDRYARQIIPQKAERTQRDNLMELRWLRSFFGGMAVTGVMPHHVAEYRDVRKGKVRANREIALLSHVFTKAAEWGVVKTNPCREIKKNKERQRDRYVTDDELEEFKKGCPEWLKVYVELKALLGLRQGDMLRLHHDNVRVDGVTTHIQKTRKWLTIRKTSEVEALLSRLKTKSGYFFQTTSGQPYSSAGFSSIWRRLMAKYVSNGGQRFTEHDLRGKVATDIDDPLAAQKLLGHKSIKMTEAYIKQRKTDVVDPLTRAGDADK